MIVAKMALNNWHLATSFCCRGMERKWRRLAEEEARAGIYMSLTSYGIPLIQFTSFKYMGQFLAA